jgi:glycosyltransferase involved in cell wall biosynthesis
VTTPEVTIITPTRNRAQFLRRAAQCVFAQAVAWEWRVHDDSPAPDEWMQALAARDPRVHYVHEPMVRSIGAKRNMLIAAARASCIAHFDDDDVYGPGYLQNMVGALKHHGADMLKLSGFYLYAPASDFLGYTDLNVRSGRFFELSDGGCTVADFTGDRELGADFIGFYGFSYVYRRDAALRLPYQDINLFDDARFAESWAQDGRRIAMTDFAARHCLRWVHPGATSRTYSIYRIPTFLLNELFPFMAALDPAPA